MGDVPAAKTKCPAQSCASVIQMDVKTWLMWAKLVTNLTLTENQTLDLRNLKHIIVI